MPSVEPRAKKTEVNVQPAVPERAHEGVDPQAGADGEDVDGGGGEEPESCEGGGAEAGVEEVVGGRVRRVRPSSDGLVLPVVVLVNVSVKRGIRVDETVGGVVD